jgi:hypothetical protein
MSLSIRPRLAREESVVVSDKATGKKIEPDLPPPIGIVADFALGVSGPLGGTRLTKRAIA